MDDIIFDCTNPFSCEEFSKYISNKLNMIDFTCEVIRISIKYSCLEIFDQQVNPSFTFPLSYFLSLRLSVLTFSLAKAKFLCKFL